MGQVGSGRPQSGWVVSWRSRQLGGWPKSRVKPKKKGEMGLVVQKRNTVKLGKSNEKTQNALLSKQRSGGGVRGESKGG